MLTLLPTSPFPKWASFSVVHGDLPSGEKPSAIEMACLSPRAVPKRRRSFILGRVAARRALLALGLPATPILVGRDGSPIWPPGVVGAISHAKDLAVAVVAPTRYTDGVGIDVEQTNRLNDVTIQHLVADKDEQRWIDGQPARLVTLFSAKESLFKAFYPVHGEYFGFDAVHLERDGDSFQATLRRPLADWATGSRYRVRCQCYNGMVITSVYLPPRNRTLASRRSNQP